MDGEPRAVRAYNSLQARLEKRFSRGLSALISYTWGKASDRSPDHISTSGGGAGIDTGTFREPQDGNNLRADRGLAEFDIKHRFVASYIYELPFGRGRSWVDDWNSAADASRRMASDRHPRASDRLGFDGYFGRRHVLNIGGERRARPNLIGDPVLPESQRTLQKWFNTDAFAGVQPSPQAFGNAGVGIMRGPGLRELRFHAGEELRPHRAVSLPIPHRVLQCVQSRQFRTAEYCARQQRLRPNSLRS